MATRYSGNLQVSVVYDDQNFYRTSVSRSGKLLWRGRVNPAPAGFGPGVAYDSPEAYDEVARTALSFADHESPGERVLDGAEYDADLTQVEVRRSSASPRAGSRGTASRRRASAPGGRGRGVASRPRVSAPITGSTSPPGASGSGHGARRPSRGEIEQEVEAVRDGARRGSSAIAGDAADAALIRALYEAYLVDGVAAAHDASLSTELLDAGVRWLSPERYDTGVGVFSLARLRGPSPRSSGFWLVQLRRDRPTPVYSLSRLEHRRRGSAG